MRVKYSKSGLMRYVGHLDVMRYFQKAVRRSGIAASYSEGFSPHMIMSFAEPLGIGQTAAGDYFDLSLDYADPWGEDPDGSGREMSLPAPPPAETLRGMLDREMTEDFSVLSLRRIPAYRKDNAMAQVRAARYTIGFPFPADEDLSAKIIQYLENADLPAEKKTKSGMQTVNIRPWILSAEAASDPDPFFDDTDAIVSLFSLAGSSQNLPPLLFAKSFLAFCGAEAADHTIRVRRDDLFGESPEGYISLEDFGAVW